MKVTHKKIITREFLFLISILAVSGLLTLLSVFIHNNLAWKKMEIEHKLWKDSAKMSKILQEGFEKSLRERLYKIDSTLANSPDIDDFSRNFLMSQKSSIKEQLMFPHNYGPKPPPISDPKLTKLNHQIEYIKSPYKFFWYSFLSLFLVIYILRPFFYTVKWSIKTLRT